jgi:mono/diheme cytochrome c family protein
MKAKIIILVLLICAVTGVYQLFITYDNRFPFGRMWETPAIRPHEESVPYMSPGRVPWDGGEAQYRFVPGEALISPVSAADPSIIQKGGELYGTYCMQCHGKYQDGNGTVGQSFAPLPGDLRSARVQSTSVGVIFQEVSYGIPGGRQPPLATTISVQDRWLIIAYVKSLGVKDD